MPIVGVIKQKPDAADEVDKHNRSVENIDETEE